MDTTTSISPRLSNAPGEETTRAARKRLSVMLLASAALMLAWSLAVPVFEAPDEPAHWQYANYLNQNHALPVEGRSFPEAASPPLYYLLIAPLASHMELPPIGFVGQEEGNRYLLFPPRLYQNDSQDFGRFWPFRAARLLSVLISFFTIWFCALAGSEASGRRSTGLLAGGLVAFWPMFTFRAMNVSNDSLMTMLSALALYLLVRMIKRGFTWRVGIYAALVTAGAFLCKINAIVLPCALHAGFVFRESPVARQTAARDSAGRHHDGDRHPLADPERASVRRASCSKHHVHNGRRPCHQTLLWLEILPFLLSLSLHHVVYRVLWLDECVLAWRGVLGLPVRTAKREERARSRESCAAELIFAFRPFFAAQSCLT